MRHRWIRGGLGVPAVLAAGLAVSCGGPGGPEPAPLPEAGEASAAMPEETRFEELRQLTFGGENAEAYFSADGRRLIFQSTRDGFACDQIFIMDLDTQSVRLVSTGRGRTTCAYFFPDGGRILYASTHLSGPDCPPPPDYSRGYVWKLYPEYEIFTARDDGSDLRRITTHDGYDAEATVRHDGKIIFTSLREGDLDLYTMNPDGSDVRRITRELGYDGGAFFSPDGTRIVWRASRPETPEEVEEYRALIRESAIRPMNLELYTANADGSEPRQLTRNGAANFAPYFHPDGRRIIFASNQHEPEGRNFDLYLTDVDGSFQERVTWHPAFDGFPVFSPDGQYLVFSSNRNAAEPGETNLFLARWRDETP